MAGPMALVTRRVRGALKSLSVIALIVVLINVVTDTWYPQSVALEVPVKTVLVKDTSVQRREETNTSIILYAQYRGGSTFGGEFLNKHEDIAFIYEPLCGDRHGGTVKDKAGILEDVLECRFHDTPATKQIFYGWRKHQMFCQLPKQTPGCHSYGLISVEKAERHCRNSPHKAIKVIRVTSLKELEKYMYGTSEEHPKGRGVKVVHLIRDPRGTLNSRQKLWRKTNVEKNSAELCLMGVADLQYVRQAVREGRHGFLNNYYQVRYEDLAADAIGELRKIYEFLGIAPDSHVTEWALSQSKHSQDGDTHVSQKEAQKDNNKFIYGTSRENPAYTAQLWRKTMTLKNVKTVQTQCEDYMRHFGYRILDSEEDKNDILANSVVLPLNIQELYKRND